uniref:Uncharacterized protein n=1 Tax=Anguilla anguilla TaxID=7936 RepID=A0A0E9SMQ5_ANGAN
MVSGLAPKSIWQPLYLKKKKKQNIKIFLSKLLHL